MGKYIVRLTGGLGNQMFQYAFSQALQAQGKEVSVDLSWYDKFDAHNGYELDSVFGIKPILAAIKDCRRLGYNQYDVYHRFRAKYLPKKTYHRQDTETALKYDSTLFSLDEGYFAGYYQSEKYFDNIKSQIRKEFSFKNTVVNGQNLKYAEKMRNTESVSIHVRRGDYVNNSLYEGICTEDYYKQAIDFTKESKPDAKFFIFSNDIAWCKEKFGNQAEYVEGNIGQTSWVDMYLMSCCKHHIIANSSFSWWGAWLGEREGSIIIAPVHWLNGVEDTDVVSKRWISVK